ncbi:zinc-binding dehydrogenase [Oceanobacillus sp. CFH 90083]|uniref:zinc-dependent alcohol dehydrogenase n=1 Tax=Oceanobacillus sp. CFH 90083 TaxID=2592336 RepID=UPI00128CD4F4|nr:alcohol dehydrogenase catalytic domain-containing protein [Oceanobacillus sp. CFH 90083]
MLQAIMVEPGKIEYRDIPIPEVQDHQVKLKIKSIGVCGSDIHVNHGKHPYTSYPVVQGHEVAAEVIEIGSEVEHLKAGDKVTVQPQDVCGKCYPCRNNNYNACEELKVFGFQTTGMASEYFVVDARKVLPLPKDMTWDQGALIEPLAVAVHAVKRVGDVKGKKVLVLGGGPIGNLVAQSAKALGAEKVLISELSKHRLKVAEDCGIATVDASKDSVESAVDKHFGPDKADYIFECVGINPTMDQAINVARKGSTIVVVGVFADLGNINMGFIQDHELTLKGSAMYQEEDYLTSIELVKNNLVNLDSLITNHVHFKSFKDAYDLIDEQKDKVMKVMIEME